MPNGLEQSIGRLEGKMELIISMLDKQDTKIDTVEQLIGKLKGSCPLYTGKPLKIKSNGNGELKVEPVHKKKITEKLKDQLPTAGWVTAVFTITEFVKWIIINMKP